jgi:hypothetical protein
MAQTIDVGARIAMGLFLVGSANFPKHFGIARMVP